MTSSMPPLSPTPQPVVRPAGPPPSESEHQADLLDRHLSTAPIVEMESPDVLRADPGLHALLWNDVEATAWEVSNPSYDAAILTGAQPLFLGYPLRADDLALQGLLRTWFEIQESRGALQSLYGEWILGKGQATAAPPMKRLVDWAVDSGTPWPTEDPGRCGRSSGSGWRRPGARCR